MASGTIERDPGFTTQEHEGYVPLGNIELEGTISPEIVHTAGHELNHALVAYLRGVSIEEISVKPEGNILGKTVLSGSVSDYDMQLIAVSGSISTHDGTAKGFGSDMFKVHRLNRNGKGVDPGSAKSAAETILNNFSHDMREMMALLLAHKGSLSGRQIPDLIQRAKIELKKRNKIQQQPHTKFVSQLMSRNEEERNIAAQDDTPEEENMRIELTDVSGGLMKAQWIRDGQKIREKFYCTQCGGADGHFDGCPTSKTAEKPEVVSKREKRHARKSNTSIEVRRALAGERVSLFTHPFVMGSRTTSSAGRRKLR